MLEQGAMYYAHPPDRWLANDCNQRLAHQFMQQLNNWSRWSLHSPDCSPTYPNWTGHFARTFRLCSRAHFDSDPVRCEQIRCLFWWLMIFGTSATNDSCITALSTVWTNRLGGSLGTGPRCLITKAKDCRICSSVEDLMYHMDSWNMITGFCATWIGPFLLPKKSTGKVSDETCTNWLCLQGQPWLISSFPFKSL